MAQRQFRSDDTSPWLDAFGNGAAGALTISANTADSARTGYANTTISGTEAAFTATAGSGTGFASGDLVIIHQSRNGGDGAGVWEFNKIASVGAGTNWTMAYALTHDYGTTAQVYRLIQNSAITIDSTKILTGVDWDGSKGGLVVLMAKGTVTITGSITVNSKGYLGGTADNGSNNTYTGEGTVGAPVLQQTTANGNGGGCKILGSGDGGGGGNGAAGQGGSGPGDAVGDAGLTVMVFGGGGGGMSRGEGSPYGGDGGGIVIIVAKTIVVTGGITTTGQDGAAGGPTGSGGGAGGSVLFKGQSITLGSTLVTGAGGAGPYTNGGGAGRIHADYKDSISGTTSPALDSRQDASLIEQTGGGALFGM